MRPSLRPPCCEPLERRTMLAAAPEILFIRGAARSGGFLEGAGAIPRDAQLADINDTSTAAGNTGWGTLAATLRAGGFAVTQIVEGTEPGAPSTGFVEGAPIRFETMDLNRYAAIVFGSNNAAYPRASVDAIENYIRNGGGALFISDANFGSTWRDAPDSDQPFLSRFGLTVNQDNGVYPLTRAADDFTAPDHPVLARVDEFDGEGVSPISLPLTRPAGVQLGLVVRARSNVRLNNGDANPAERFQGTLRPAIRRDAALVLAHAGRGRVAAYFDRNTFFNANGNGTDITRLDNRQLARNLFGWVADRRPPGVRSVGFTRGSPHVLRVAFNDNLHRSLTRSDVILRYVDGGTLMPGSRWVMSVSDSPAGTQLMIRIDANQPAARYQFQINRGRISDDAGNANALIRFDFTIAPPAATLAPTGPSSAIVTRAAATSAATTRIFDEIFSRDPIA